MTLRLFDIGGSGVKTIKSTNEYAFTDHSILNYEHYENPDWGNFVTWAYNTGLLDAEFIGISCAGFILPNEVVKLFKVGNWYNKRIGSEILAYTPDSKVFLLNDAEAHLMAHHGLYKNPQMCISLGTSFGFAVSNSNGEIMRSLDDVNYDLGEIAIQTRASNNKVWWALGSHGLKELQKRCGNDNGVKHFGYRLGSFLVNICSIFRPKTVVFSGGITENWWHLFHQTMQSEFNQQKPNWLEDINFVKSPYCSNAALVGIGKYVIEK
jgi:predicted NBD/HSP70 family sugar kinase